MTMPYSPTTTTPPATGGTGLPTFDYKLEDPQNPQLYAAGALRRAEESSRNFTRQTGSAGGAMSDAFARGRFRNEALSGAADEATQRALDDIKRRAGEYALQRNQYANQRGDIEHEHNWGQQLIHEGWQGEDRTFDVMKRERDYGWQSEDRTRSQTREDEALRQSTGNYEDANAVRDRNFTWDAEDRPLQVEQMKLQLEQLKKINPLLAKQMEQALLKGQYLPKTQGGMWSVYGGDPGGKPVPGYSNVNQIPSGGGYNPNTNYFRNGI